MTRVALTVVDRFSLAQFVFIDGGDFILHGPDESVLELVLSLVRDLLEQVVFNFKHKLECIIELNPLLLSVLVVS
jgi:hypothetical protein